MISNSEQFNSEDSVSLLFERCHIFIVLPTQTCSISVLLRNNSGRFFGDTVK